MIKAINIVEDKKDENKHKIVCKKWIDPYLFDLSDVEWPGYDDDNDNENVYDDGYSDSEENEDITHMGKMKVLATPMGLIPMTEHSTPSKVFNFWEGHTNFNITDGVKEIVNKTDGVETFDIFTRYRMRIGIGKIFKPKDVMYSINTSLNKYLQSKDETNGKG